MYYTNYKYKYTKILCYDSVQNNLLSEICMIIVLK